MTVDFITTEALTDDQILKCFGETLLYGEGNLLKMTSLNPLKVLQMSMGHA